MGMLVLAIEIARALKKKKEDRTMSPEQIFVRDNPINEKNKENYLAHIDIFLKNGERKWVIKECINEYISFHSKDNEILKRIDLMNEMEDE